MKILTVAKYVLALTRTRFDRHDVALVCGSCLVAAGLACYSIPMALIAVGGSLVALAIYGATR